MVVRIRTLEARASLDGAKYKQGADQIAASDSKMAQSQQRVQGAMSQTQVRVSESASSFDKFRRSLDPAYAAQQKLEAGTRRLSTALSKGDISATQHAALIGKLRERYADAAVGQTRMARGLEALQGSVSRIAGSLSALTLGLGAFGAVQVARGVFETALAFERVDKTLLAATGSTQKAAAEFEFLRAKSNELGLNLRQSATEYGKLAAAARGTSLEGAGARDIFVAISEASTAMGLSAEQSGGALTAIQQIISKGTVSAEELRGQLGERLPGAFNVAARAMGVTTQQLGKLLQTGSLAADEFLPKFAAEIRKTFADLLPEATRGAQAALNRFENAFAELQLNLARSGFLEAVVDAMNDIRDVMTDPAFLSGIRAFGAAIKDAFAFVVNNKDLLLTVAAAYLGAKVGRVAGPVGALVGALGGAAAVGGPDKRAQLRTLDDRIAAISGQSESRFIGTSKAAVLAGLQASRDDLAASIPKQIGYLNLAKGAVNLVSEALSEAGLEAGRFWDRLGGGKGSGAGKSGGSSAGGGGGAKAAKSGLADYVKGLDQALRLAKLTSDEREVEQAVLQAISIGQKDANAATLEHVRLTVKATQEVEKQRDLEAERAKALAAQLEDAKRQQEDFANDVRSELGNAFSSIFKNGKDGWDDLLDYWKNKLLDWIADMAARALQDAIVVPVVQGQASGLGGANFGGTGGGFNLQSLGSIGGVNVGSALGTAGLAYGIYQAGSSLATTLLDFAGKKLSEDSRDRAGLIGGLTGGIGGFLYGLFASKPSNASAVSNIDAYGSATYQNFAGKTTPENSAKVADAAQVLRASTELLTAAGVTFTDRVSQLVIGSRDASSYTLASGVTGRSGAVGDPAELAGFVVKKLLETAKFANADVAQVAGRSYASNEELVAAVKFTTDVYGAIIEARRPLTQVEQAMKDLTDGFKTARKEAEKLGLSLEKFDAGARNTFNQDIADQILAIVDPVAASLSEFERSAAARVDVARQLGADLVAVERLNGLERARVLAQAEQASVATLRSLIDDLQFGGLSAGVAPEQQYFSALSSYNDARRSALDLRTPEAISSFDQASRALLPIAQSFLGVSERYADVRSEILSTAQTLGTSTTDASSAAIVAATVQGSNAVVEQVKANTQETKRIGDELVRNNAYLQALLSRRGAA